MTIYFRSGQILFSGGAVAMSSACCCCQCDTLAVIPACPCVDTDYGTLRSARSVQVDISLSPSVYASTTSKVKESGVCGSLASVSCPSINGTYVLDETHDIAPAPDNTADCRVLYSKRVHTEICSSSSFTHCLFDTPASGTFTLCAITELRIIAYLLGTANATYLPSYLMATVSVSSDLLWIHNSKLTSIDYDNYTTLPSVLSVVGTGYMVRLGCGSGSGGGDRWAFTYAQPATLHYWKYTIGGTCGTSCNTSVAISSCVWGSSNSPAFTANSETNGDGSTNYGCAYGTGSVTVTQLS